MTRTMSLQQDSEVIQPEKRETEQERREEKLIGEEF